MLAPTYIGDNWASTWHDTAEAIADEHGGPGGLVNYPNPPAPLDGPIASIAYGEAEALTEAWRAVAAAAGLKWTPSALGPPPPDPSALLPIAVAASWWASTAQLALDLDAAGYRAAPFTISWPGTLTVATADAEPSNRAIDVALALLIAVGTIGVAVHVVRSRREEH